MNRRKREKGGWQIKAMAVIAIAVCVVVFFDGRLRGMVESVIEYQTKIAAFRIVNTAMLDELERDNIDYEDIVRLTYSADGAVQSVQTNVSAVNKIKGRMSAAVVGSLEDKQNQVIEIPMGTLLGNQITTGMGPDVEIKVIPIGYVQSELYNEFSSAGINQTLHQIMMRTTVKMLAVMPGYNIETEISTNFCIAETVIVGKVPDGYTVIEGDDSSTISKINDYKAGENISGGQ